MPIRPDEFCGVIRPLLAEACPNRLAAEVHKRWTPSEVCQLLGEPERDIRRLAAVALGLVGDRTVIGRLARALHDEDEQVNQLAEDALWSVWFRSGDPEAAEPFQAGVQMIAEERYDHAVEQLIVAQQIDPDFAEAFNQAAIAHFLAEHWEPAIEDCRQTIKLMPSHFGALSGLGHCYAHFGRLEDALGCYERSLQINPNMPGIQSAVCRLRDEAGYGKKNNQLKMSSDLSELLDHRWQ